MSIPKFTKDLNIIQKLSDLPNATDGLTAEQLKAKFDEAAGIIQAWINDTLIPSIVADKIPFLASTEIDADNIGDAIRDVQTQIKDASTGTIANGAVTREKLAAALLARVYGGRPWVSMNTPGSEQNVEADFPIGQIWLRPRFTVNNLAGESWTASGCTVSPGDNKITVTGSNTVVTASISQALANLGQEGDRVVVLFTIANRDSEITALTASINGGEEQDAGTGVYDGVLLANGSLTVKLSATWPSTSLAGGSFDVVHYAVVNIDQVLRQTVDAEEIRDWGGYLQGLLPLGSYTSPEAAYIQTISGTWWPMSYSVQPVSRGGTGNETVGYGELLYGGDERALERLAAGEDNSFLLFSGGRPVWMAAAEAAAGTGMARVVTGSYKGTGGARTITLPVEPKLLHISSPSGCYSNSYTSAGGGWSDRPCTLCQGGVDGAPYTVSVESGYSWQTATVSLSGKVLTLDGPYFCNRANVTYNYTAIY